MKGVVSTFLVLATLLVTARANAQFFNPTNDVYTFTTNAGGQSLTLTGLSYLVDNSLTLPSTNNGLPVTCVGQSAFDNILGPNFNDPPYSSAIIFSVIIPSTVTNIGPSAFYNLDTLTNVAILGPLASLGDAAFFGCSQLSSIAISGNLTSIGENAFAGCTSLKNATIPNSVTSIGASAFEECTNLASFLMPASLTNIGQMAFFGCSHLNGVLLPGSLTGIEQSAFETSGLTNIILPNSLTSVGEGAFQYCPLLASVFISASVTNLGTSAFGSCPSLDSINLDPLNPDYITSNGVLFDKQGTTLVECPGGVTGTYSIPSGVTEIASGAFNGCSSLSGVNIPASVTDLTPFVFCTNLTAITVDPQNPVYCSVNGAVFDKAQTTLVTFPGGVAGNYAVPGNVMNIGTSAFFGCTRLTRIVIPPGVTNIGAAAFAECSSLTNVNIPDGITSIQDETFTDCESLANLTIPASVTNIGNLVFTREFFAVPISIFFKGNAPTFAALSFTDASHTLYDLPNTLGWTTGFLDGPILWNPQIQTTDGFFGIQNGRFGFNVTGTAGIPVQLEVCTNLANQSWLPLETITLTNGSFYYSEPSQPGKTGRYFRLAIP